MPNLITGTSITLGTLDLVVPALSVRQYREYRDAIARIAAITDRNPTPEELNDILVVVHAAVSRNHPEITRDQLEDLVDLSNVVPLAMAAVGARQASGFTTRSAPTPAT